MLLIALKWEDCLLLVALNSICGELRHACSASRYYADKRFVLFANPSLPLRTDQDRCKQCQACQAVKFCESQQLRRKSRQLVSAYNWLIIRKDEISFGNCSSRVSYNIDSVPKRVSYDINLVPKTGRSTVSGPERRIWLVDFLSTDSRLHRSHRLSDQWRGCYSGVVRRARLSDLLFDCPMGCGMSDALGDCYEQTLVSDTTFIRFIPSLWECSNDSTMIIRAWNWVDPVLKSSISSFVPFIWNLNFPWC